MSIDTNFNFSTRNSEFPKAYSAYASQTVTVSGSATDYSLKDNTTLFDVVSMPVEVLIRNGSSNISFKYNSINNDTILLYANCDYGTQSFRVTDILVTVSGSNPASMDISTLGWK
jgi:hypothetical protein